MSRSSSKLIDASFPTELLLEVFQHVPFDRSTMLKLSLVHRRFHTLLKHHQKSITKSLARRQLPHARADFPCHESALDYRWLSRCIRQYDVVDDIMAVLVSHLNCFAVERHNMAAVNAGFLLLYRLNSLETHTAKLTLIQSLPRDSVVAIFLAVHYSKLTARYHGKGLISQGKYSRFLDANQLELRNEIEFCFSEGILGLGPEFVNEVLQHHDECETKLHTLYHTHATHDWDTDPANNPDTDFMPPLTIGPHLSPDVKPRSLFTTLQERLAELLECSLEGVVAKVLDETEILNHRLAWLCLSDKARLVAGYDVEELESQDRNPNRDHESESAPCAWCLERSGI